MIAFLKLAFFKHTGKTIAVMTILAIMAFLGGKLHDYIQTKEDKQVLICNEEQLKDNIAVLERRLQQAALDKASLEDELSQIRAESERRQGAILVLQDILDNPDIEDDNISDKTRAFYLELNNRAKELRQDDEETESAPSE